MDSLSTYPAQLTDQELAKRSVAGSHGSFDILVSRYSVRLCHFLRPRLPNPQDVEDVIQDTFIKAYQNIHRYQPQWKFSTWLYTIAARLAISFYRSGRWKLSQLTRAHDPDTVNDWADPHPFATPLADDLLNIWSLARQLKPQHYEILWLHYAEELPAADIAIVLNKSTIHVRVLLHRARLHLTRLLTPTPDSKTIPPAPSQEGAVPTFSFL